MTRRLEAQGAWNGDVAPLQVVGTGPMDLIPDRRDLHRVTTG